MNILMFVLTIINALVYLYAFLVDISQIQKKGSFKAAFNKGIDLGKNFESQYDELQDQSKKVGFVIGAVITLFVFVIVAVSKLLFPIIIGFTVGIEAAFITYFLLTQVGIVIRIIAENKRPLDQINHKKTLLRAILFIFYLQVLLIVLFGFFTGLDTMIQQIYESSFLFKNSITIFMPTIYFGSIGITIYLYYVGIMINSKLNESNKYFVKFRNILLVIVLSSFAGLLYLIESNLDFIDFSAGGKFDRVLNVFVFLLSSIMIPLMFNLINQAKNNIANKNNGD